MAKNDTKEFETRSGFISGLTRGGLNAEFWVEEATRPVCSSERPLGRAKGDGGFLIHDANGPSLVILELEASGPGNERNIMKWATPAGIKSTLRIRPGTYGEPREFAAIDVVLCFGLPEFSDWSASDFKKTVAHCDFLAGTMNDRLRNSPIRFTVLSAEERVESWSEFGHISATQYIAQRARTS